MVFNGVTISADIITAMKAWDAKDYKTFGYTIGNTLMLATQTQDNMFLY